MALNRSARSNTLTMDYDSRTSANKSKFMKDRVTYVERSFGDICDSFGALARGNGKLRDKHDVLCQHLLSYAENSTYNSTSKESVSQLTRELASCNDYQDALVKRIEGQVVEPLMLFDTIIKNSRISDRESAHNALLKDIQYETQSQSEIQAAFTACEKEQKSKKTVDQVRDKHPSDQHKLRLAETELQKAKVDASRSTKALEEAIDAFEQRKLKDLKDIVGSYMRIQMSYHAKCLESLTKAYRSLSIYDDEEDLKEFRNVLHPTSASERQKMLKNVGGGSRHSLTSEKSQHSAKFTDSKPATPKTASKPPAGGSNMFTASLFQAASSPKHATPSKRDTPPKPQSKRSAMMGDDDSETDSGEDQSDSDMEELPTYSNK